MVLINFGMKFSFSEQQWTSLGVSNQYGLAIPHHGEHAARFYARARS